MVGLSAMNSEKNSLISRIFWWMGALLIWFYLFRLAQSLVALTPPKAGVNVLYMWLMVGAGFAVLAFIFLVRPPAFKFNFSFPEISLPAARFLSIGIFLVTVVVLKSIDVSWVHYRDTGLTVIVYTAGRLILVFYLFTLCLASGALALRRPLRNLSDIIYSFFLGGTLYAIVFTVAGFLGLLKLWVALVLTVPVLYFVPPLIGSMARSGVEKIKKTASAWDSLQWGTHFMLGWFLVLAGGFLLFSNGLYPGPTQNDEWEHYLHYFRKVLETGSVGPNEIWYHFYVSKAAGLVFMSGLFSDFFSEQLVSVCFAVITCLIVFDLLRLLIKESFWAMAGALIYIALYDGSFLRHHVALAGYIAFFAWASIRFLENPEAHRRAFKTVLPVSAFYIGFYIPPAAGLIVLFFGFLAFAVLGVKKIRRHFPSLFMMSLTTGLGILAVLWVNYSYTGLAEMVPMRAFWKMADLKKFEALFGTVGADFFLEEQSSVGSTGPQSQGLPLYLRYDWFEKTFRVVFFQFSHLRILLILLAVFLVWKLLHKDRFRGLGRHIPWLLAFGAIFMAGILMSQMAYIASTYRLFAFIIFFSTVTWMVVVKKVTDAFAAEPVKRYLSAALCLILSVSAMAQTAQATGTTRAKSIASYMVGRLSFEGVTAEADTHFSIPASLKLFTQLRDKIGPTTRVLCLSYVPSPGYLIPGVGIVSEPSYSFGSHHREILEGTPERAREILQKLNINYFIVTRRSVYLPSTLILSKLFQAKNMGKMFQVVSTDNDNYVLTWRDPKNTEPLSVALTQTMELRQERSLYYPFTNSFSKLSNDYMDHLNRIVDQMPLDTQEHLITYLSSSLAGVLKQKMLDNITLPENKILLNDVIVCIEKKMNPEISRLVREAAIIVRAQPESAEERRKLFQKLIKENLGLYIKPSILAAYSEEADQDEKQVLKFSISNVPYVITLKVD